MKVQQSSFTREVEAASHLPPVITIQYKSLWFTLSLNFSDKVFTKEKFGKAKCVKRCWNGDKCTLTGQQIIVNSVLQKKHWLRCYRASKNIQHINPWYIVWPTDNSTKIYNHCPLLSPLCTHSLAFGGLIMLGDTHMALIMGNFQKQTTHVCLSVLLVFVTVKNAVFYKNNQNYAMSIYSFYLLPSLWCFAVILKVKSFCLIVT